MTIGRIGHIEPIQPGREGGWNGRVTKSNEGDSVNISREAKERAEDLKIRGIVNEAPDVRAERVAELKQKMNDPHYINDILIGATADKILDSLGI